MKRIKQHKYFRSCPSCNILIGYTTESSFKVGNSSNTKCTKCTLLVRYRVLDKGKLSIEIKNKILKLYNEDYNNIEIANKLNISDTTVGKFLKSKNLISNHHKKYKLIITENGFGICRVCKEEKEVIYFSFNKRKNICSDCKRNYFKKIIYSSTERNLQYRLNNLRSRARRNNIAFDLSLDYVIQLYNDQKGKCFYTKQVMTLDVDEGSSYKETSLSFDKIIPEKGYTTDNVVLCSRKINIVKSSLSLYELKKYIPLFYKRIIKKFPALKIN